MKRTTNRPQFTQADMDNLLDQIDAATASNRQIALEHAVRLALQTPTSPERILEDAEAFADFLNSNERTS